jgi:hypothetical protein
MITNGSLKNISGVARPGKSHLRNDPPIRKRK